MEYTPLLMIMFPEFLKYYYQHAKWAKELFYKYPTTAQITRMHTDTIVGILRIKGDCFAAERIIALARETIGNVSNINQLLLTSV